MIVIPMAGLSRRFTDAGYDRPKYMLALRGRSLFAHAVGSFARYFDTEPFLFVARDGEGVAAFLAAEIKALGIANASTVMLQRPTVGQADTVRLGLERAGTGFSEPLTIFNIDTFRPGFRFPNTSWMREADGYLEVMPGSDPGFSFVRPLGAPEDARVAETAEKTVISSLASTGLYWFRRAGDFIHAASGDPDRVGAKGELFVAPLYNALIAEGRDIRFQLVSSEEVVFCGTPAQYEDLLAHAAAQPDATAVTPTPSLF